MADGLEKPLDRTSKPTGLAPVFSHKAPGREGTNFRAGELSQEKRKDQTEPLSRPLPGSASHSARARPAHFYFLNLCGSSFLTHIFKPTFEQDNCLIFYFFKSVRLTGSRIWLCSPMCCVTVIS